MNNFNALSRAEMKDVKKLSRTEMKNVTGGCAFSCDGFRGNNGYTKKEAIAQANENVTSGRCKTATWCCASC